jgi:hypothetical protein
MQVTAQMKADGNVFGITLLDPIISNRNRYFRFLEAGHLAPSQGAKPPT